MKTIRYKKISNRYQMKYKMLLLNNKAFKIRFRNYLIKANKLTYRLKNHSRNKKTKILTESR